MKVRLACIDAPEASQAPYGMKSRSVLQSLLSIGSEVTLKTKAVDRYGRSVAEVLRGSTNINQSLVGSGYAYVYCQYISGCDRQTTSMLKTSSNGTQATTIKFALRPTAETLADLSRPIDPRHLKTRKQGNTTLTYVPWATLARHLHHRAPSWNWEIQSVQEVGGSVVVTGRLTIPTTDGLLHYSACASEPLESASKAPPAEVAASSCLRRAAALAGLGLSLWG